MEQGDLADGHTVAQGITVAREDRALILRLGALALHDIAAQGVRAVNDDDLAPRLGRRLQKKLHPGRKRPVPHARVLGAVHHRIHLAKLLNGGAVLGIAVKIDNRDPRFGIDKTEVIVLVFQIVANTVLDPEEEGNVRPFFLNDHVHQKPPVIMNGRAVDHHGDPFTAYRLFQAFLGQNDRAAAPEFHSFAPL